MFIVRNNKYFEYLCMKKYFNQICPDKTCGDAAPIVAAAATGCTAFSVGDDTVATAVRAINCDTDLIRINGKYYYDRTYFYNYKRL